MMRYPSISHEEQVKLAELKTNRINYKSFFPVDPKSCTCHGEINDIQQQMARMNTKKKFYFKKNLGVYTCKRKNKNYDLFGIYCKTCKFLVITLNTKDISIGNDWYDLHYYTYSINKKNKNYWRGALTVNINKATGNLGIECACGVDTRKPNSKGRDFGLEDSKFNVKKLNKAPQKGFITYG